MKKSAIYRMILAYLISSAVLIAFGLTGWYFDQPFKTNPAIFAVSIIVFSSLAMSIAGYGYSRLMTVLRIGAYLSYLVGTIGLGNVLVSLAWSKSVYMGIDSAWAIIVAIIFLATHGLREKASVEVQEIQKQNAEEADRLAAQNNVVAAA